MNLINVMKKIIFIILIFLSTNFCYSQEQIHVDKTGYSYDWKLSNKACNGCASFYVQICRTKSYAKNGYYTYYVYFYSNSFYANGHIASTYIIDINIFIVDASGYRQKILGPFWVLAPPKSDYSDGVYLGATLYSKDPYQIINVTWGQFSVY